MRRLLWAGLLVPIIYFGVQPIAARFYPGYSFVRQSASELGSDRSDRPSVLNTGAILTGVLTLIASAAIPSALRKWNSPRVVAWATALAMVSMGVGAIWAGIFSLPDPRHNSGAIGAGAFLVPLLFAIAVWRASVSALLKAYFIGNLVVLLLMIPVMSGKSGIDINDMRGALQRVAAAVLYLPVGVASAALLRR